MKNFLKKAPLFLSLGLMACTPRIELETPKEGITINMNVVVDHKINVEMDKGAQKVLSPTKNKASE